MNSLCEDCGACCQFNGHIELDAGHHIPDQFATADRLDGAPEGHCPAYNPANKLCRIYEIRPLVCQQFVVDGAACNYARGVVYGS